MTIILIRRLLPNLEFHKCNASEGVDRKKTQILLSSKTKHQYFRGNLFEPTLFK